MVMCGQPRLLLFACRHIDFGTELRFDYGVQDLPWRKVLLPFWLSHQKFSRLKSLPKISGDSLILTIDTSDVQQLIHLIYCRASDINLCVIVFCRRLYVNLYQTVHPIPAVSFLIEVSYSIFAGRRHKIGQSAPSYILVMLYIRANPLFWGGGTRGGVRNNWQIFSLYLNSWVFAQNPL